MELEPFLDILATRIPTAGEFVSFAVQQKWQFRVDGSRAALLVPDNKDPFALGFAKMLSREPYRTRVLEHLATMDRTASPRESQDRPQPAAEPASDPDEEACAKCGRVTDAEDRDVLATNYYLCDRTECPFKVAARRAERRAA